MQLPLPVTLPDDETLASFVPGANQQLVSLLTSVSKHSPDWRSEATLAMLDATSIPMVNIVGGAGRGKSHLLYAVCHQLAERNIPHAYLSFKDVKDLTPRVLESLEQLPVICLDNLEVLNGDPDWEEALFDLINRVTETRVGMLIIASRFGPQSDVIQLPDLRSRIGAGLTFQVLPLSDEQRGEVLSLRAQQRGLVLTEQALHYLLNHSQRDLPSLVALLDRLDKRSLQEQKKITVALVKRELAETPSTP